ncbi:BZ3500_MvSof-1268-A1-R1_Chr5-3g08183 [Microbotryum saponariae]|uniref:BZ3500_MvSof-1268-A1-R1_Chr5-3g08183 protein n=1 Tax=Microbotryum saponariae TaxID=289078 RepID=A0A2X0NIX5_9BASI|nr:BZ3500_MvSof-1268-A1-R1_Chr5-3g08183 [Microbotryum saponariae]SDA07942.1 BZ3501_MvSof-1269-A2-R1_Chr5-1g07327 [Microbotryum saponariae]
MPVQARQVSVITLCLSIFYMLATTLLATLLSLRALSGDRAARAWPLFKVLSCLSIFMAYLFVLAEAIMILGLQSDTSFLQVCAIGTYVGIGLYTVFKLVFYVLLMERVHLVYGYKTNVPIRRLEAPWYWFSLTVVAAWTAVSLSMLIARLVQAKGLEEICFTTIKSYASIVMLVVNTVTAAFALPVVRSRFSKSQRLALTSCIATALGTLASAGNLLWMMHVEGPERAWSRGISSSMDVIFNAVLAFAITTTPGRKAGRTNLKQVKVDIRKMKRLDTCPPSSPRSLHGVIITRQTSQLRDDEEPQEGGEPENGKVPVVGWLDRVFPDQHPAKVKDSLGLGTRPDSFSSENEYKAPSSRPKTPPDRMATRSGDRIPAVP